MTRIFVISLTASLLALWAVFAKAEGLHANGHFHSINAAHAYGPHPAEIHAWPRTNHEPAIGKTLTPPHTAPAQSEPSADYQYEWQRQPAPIPPHLAVPQQFSYPQQGYFPREGKVEQAPGYEYDFGGAGSYPPLVPMEGANWLGPKKPNRRWGFHAPQPFAHGSGIDTHYGCLHW